MLAKIWIKNFALIQELHFDFSSGYTVITGETGSGKSILLGAINLILGERADFSLIGPDQDKTFVEVEFKVENLNLKNWFTENEVDYDALCVVRREINRQGRSRAFVNDTPVQLQQLKQLTEKLVNIHSQHHTIALKDKEFHLVLLDTLAGLQPKANTFEQNFERLKNKKRALKIESEKVAKAEADRDYLTFQLEELANLNLANTDYEKLENELKFQENSGEIIAALESICATLEDENGSLSILKFLKSKLEKNGILDGKVQELTSRLNSTILELEDIANESSSYLENLDQNPERIVELTLKVDAFNRVCQKHKCTNQMDLQILESQWKEQLNSSTEGRNVVERLRQEIALEEEKLIKEASDLHKLRIKSKSKIEEDITLILADLKMPNTTLDFNLTAQTDLNKMGATAVNMLFSSNKGIPVQAIEKIASGGELSRLMLAIQCLISEVQQLPSIIFDEIDTGVSGEVASKIGQLLKRMGQNLQLIAISHLPQVAGKAANHIRVEKFEKNGRTLSNLRSLSDVERIEEVARLMSGEAINAAALANAKTLIDDK